MSLIFFKKGPGKIKPIKEKKEEKKEEQLEKERFKIELLREEINALKEKDKLFDERISRISESIGEIREMSMNTEKDLRELEIKTEKALEIIKETKPEKIDERIHQINIKLEKQKAEIDKLRTFLETINEKQKEIDKKMSLFRGAETLLELNKEIREELIKIKKIEDKIERDADKVESIFITYQKEFNELAEMKKRFDDVEKLQKDIVKEIDNINIKMKALLTKREFQKQKIKIERLYEKFEKFNEKYKEIKKDSEKIERLVRDFEAIIRKESKKPVTHIKEKPKIRYRPKGLFEEIILKEKEYSYKELLEKINNSLGVIMEGRNRTLLPFLLNIEDAISKLRRLGVLSNDMTRNVIRNLQNAKDIYKDPEIVSEIDNTIRRITFLIAE